MTFNYAGAYSALRALSIRFPPYYSSLLMPMHFAACGAANHQHSVWPIPIYPATHNAYRVIRHNLAIVCSSNHPVLTRLRKKPGRSAKAEWLPPSFLLFGQRDNELGHFPSFTLTVLRSSATPCPPGYRPGRQGHCTWLPPPWSVAHTGGPQARDNQ
jgi:hypothetical protein